ncbi:hypothetical protein JCM8115_004993 [Rhodotorula mucilaginosa]|uniref:WD40 repeat-like protein n=1 Tax=Rhodotorula mucilaginosa TaxID=5537 RepID=A0A9P7BAP3_RHOMI|nr:hypothetical protein C6P46_000056 [Rhodotorula mucilaginosa]TKA57345.1 hypothetical protein B0A53_00573 [Rhodotorula sp. CCFEE 5036]
MAYTSDTDKLFLSDAQHEQSAIRAARANALADRGAPIQLPSKPISVRVRPPRRGSPSEPEAWIAESGFVVRRVALQSGKTQQVYRGHTGPVTSLDFYAVPLGGGKTREVLISGSWDKSFRVWDVQTKALLSTTVGHLDFVKAVHVIPDLCVLVTASSDKDIRVWDLAALDSFDFASLLASTGVEPDPTATAPRQGAAPPPARPLRPLPCLLALKAHTRPIEVLASYPLLRELPDGVADDEVDVSLRERTGRFALVSADSMGALKVWELWREGSGLKGELRCEVRQHEGGIYDLALSRDGEMWTASVDNSVLLAQLSLTSASAAPTPLLRIPHPAQIRSVLPLASVFPDSPYLVTGSSDELFRLIDLSSSAALDPNPAREAKREWRGIPLAAPVEGCVRAVEAHTHEVVQLCAYHSSDGQQWLLSASLDNTLRRWKWPDVLTQEMDKVVVVKETAAAEEESLLTEEEERELAELMGDD